VRQVNRILVPVDFSEHSQRALVEALAMAAIYGAEVTVLHVWEPPGVVVPAMAFGAPEEGDPELEVRQRLDDLVAAVDSPPGVRVEKRLATGVAYATIVEVAEEGSYDLVVIDTHGRSGLARFFVGSVAERVCRHAPCPVLVLRAKREASK
jgi:nucleotide-binding universal stress UspA family protein